jgi:hypothetical protein
MVILATVTLAVYNNTSAQILCTATYQCFSQGQNCEAKTKVKYRTLENKTNASDLRVHSRPRPSPR